MIIACIGCRNIQKLSVKTYLESVGASLVEQGHIITTGNAPGADQCFALGASLIDETKVELYLPWPRFEAKAVLEGNLVYDASAATEQHQWLARQAEYNAQYIAHLVEPLMLRDAMLIARFGEPVAQVIAWPDFKAPRWGGTGHTIRVARLLSIPVYLLERQCWLDPNEGTGA